MTIAKVAETTTLTKKAIRYYESAGLIESEILENGYREYSEEMIKKLVLIKALRNLSFSIEEIRICLTNETSLSSCFASKLKQLQGDKDQLSMVIELLNQFITQQRSFEDITRFQEEVEKLIQNRHIQLRILLRQVFPGDFGEILTAVYGHFLEEPLFSAEQKEAWEALVIELDELDPITVPNNLLLWAQKNNNKNEIKSTFLRLQEECGQNYEDFSHNKKEALQNYMKGSEGKTKAYPNQDLILFMAKEGKDVVEVIGKYFSILSKGYQQFYLKQSRFLHDNPELIEELKRDQMETC